MDVWIEGRLVIMLTSIEADIILLEFGYEIVVVDVQRRLIVLKRRLTELLDAISYWKGVNKEGFERNIYETPTSLPHHRMMQYLYNLLLQV